MKFRPWFLICGTLIWAGGTALYADTLNGSGGSWQTWTSATLGTPSNPAYGGPYWNNLSGDGPTNNIGWCLAGGGGCSLANAPGTLPFFGNGNAAVDNIWFSTGGSALTVSLRGVFTSQIAPSAGIDYFGYYLADSNGAPIAGSTTPLFNAGNPLSTASSFSLAANTNYGFYLENVQGQGSPNETQYWFYLDSSQNTASNGTTLDPLQHFTIFDAGGSLYLGMEDAWNSTSTNVDYNDMIVQMTTDPTPEPGSTALAALGLVALGFFARRKLAGSRSR